MLHTLLRLLRAVADEAGERIRTYSEWTEFDACTVREQSHICKR